MQQQDLTKENVLKYLTEEEIFERYLGIPVVFGKRFRNPMRDDDYPDCEFYRGSSKLFFTDYAFPEYQGDCFQIAALANGMSMPSDFFNVLRVINRDFSLGLYDGYLDSIKVIPVSRPEIIRDIVFEARKKKVFKVTVTKFTDLDLAYWDQFGVTPEILKKYNVFRAKEVWIEDTRFYHYQKEDLCYVYYFPKTKTYKIYKPFEVRSRKWRTNSNDIMGLDQVVAGDSIIITKGLKDVMSLDSVGFQAIAGQGERMNFDREIVERIKREYEHRLVIYDNDEAGIMGAEKTAEAFECNYLIMESELGIKDPAECFQAYGGEFLQDYIAKSEKWKKKM